MFEGLGAFTGAPPEQRPNYGTPLWQSARVEHKHVPEFVGITYGTTAAPVQATYTNAASVLKAG